jgi:predicted ATPase
MIRGNERNAILFDDEDKLRFIEIIYEKTQGNRFFLQAFCDG